MNLPYQPEIKVIWHPSGRREQLAEEMLGPLMQLPGVSVDHTATPEATGEIIASLGDSPGLLVAAGGDGTVHEVVNRMIEHRSPRTLCVLPLGTGNDLARSLKIPFDPQAAVDVLRSGREISLDALKFQTAEQTGWCTNMITGGNTGKYLEEITDEVKERWGVFCYLRGVVDVLKNLEAFDVTVEVDGGPAETIRALNIFVCNGQTSGGGLLVSPDAQLDDGKLDLVIVKEGDPGLIADLTANYLFSDYRDHELVIVRSARSLKLTANPPLALTSDGDSIGESPILVQVESELVRVRVPQDFAGGDGDLEP